MANPTTYFGWVMPTSTDLVTDLPADFNVFGQGVDTSMQDLLGGTTGQILSKTSATNMDFTWVTPSAGGTVNWSAVNSGGTSLSGTSLTISSISGANYLLMVWLAASSDATSGEFEIQINGDTASNYYYGGTYASGGTTDWNGSGTSGTTRIRIGALPAINSDGYGYCLLSGGNAAGVKAFESSMGSNRSGNFSSSVGGWWNNTSTISSVTVKVTAGNFDGGVLHVFKSA